MRVDLRWGELFKYLKKKCVPFSQVFEILEFSLRFLATNAPTERIFSVMNYMWSAKKSQLKTETLKYLIITKCNFSFTYSEVHDLIL